MVTNTSKSKKVHKKWVSRSPEETQRWGKDFAASLKAPAVIALTGELGSGKTCLVKGMAKGLKVSSTDEVHSPSFTLINEYQGKVPVYHMDLYRLDSEEEFCELGYEDYFYGDGVTIVEWAERIESLLPKNCHKIRLKIKGIHDREIKWSYSV